MWSLSQWRRFPADFFLGPEDERIYAAVRIGFAAVALLNLIFMWPDRQVFFSDTGIVDAGVAMNEARPFYLSVFAFAGSDTGVTAIMLVTARNAGRTGNRPLGSRWSRKVAHLPCA